ncbi:MAG: substrate-binding domain-containing protein [Kiritimatiellae bacterium]|nr:substrate-binding domain-containing protein [Kiritimatiellia bacterium]
MKAKTIKNVLLAIDFSMASWRDFATGFFGYAKENVHWNILVRNNGELRGGVACTDGIVLCGLPFVGADVAAQAAFGIPLVLVGMDDGLLPEDAPYAVSIRNDNEAIGEFAGEYLVSLGRFASFGYVGMGAGGGDWSRMRGDGFSRAVKARIGERVVFYAPPHADGASIDIDPFAAWLRSLPKPAAVFAACDRCAVSVLEACVTAGLAVPSQIAVLGVDDDRLLCDFSAPPLTSIAPDHAEEGREAVRMLERLMGSHRPGELPPRFLITGKRIVERDSTRHVAPVTELMRRAEKWIGENACREIRAGDVARSMGVSRALLDLRFRQHRGKTVAEAIAEVRMGEVEHRLAKTNQSIRAIARELGFSSPNHLRNAFRRRHGISMREFRGKKRA